MYFRETVNFHNLETAKHIAHVIFVLHSPIHTCRPIKTHVLPNLFYALHLQIFNVHIMSFSKSQPRVFSLSQISVSIFYKSEYIQRCKLNLVLTVIYVRNQLLKFFSSDFFFSQLFKLCI